MKDTERGMPSDNNGDGKNGINRNDIIEVPTPSPGPNIVIGFTGEELKAELETVSSLAISAAGWKLLPAISPIHGQSKIGAYPEGEWSSIGSACVTDLLPCSKNEMESCKCKQA